MLSFELDLAQLRATGAELGANEKQVRLAVFAATRRTAGTLRTLSARGLKDELQLRTINLLRKRLKTLRMASDAFSARSAGLTVGLWYGLNDMPVSWFKGRPKRTADGAQARGQNFPGAFVAQSDFKGRRTILKREGRQRLPVREQNLDVKDQAETFIEDEIFVKVEEIFWKNFRRDLSARVRFNIGER